MKWSRVWAVTEVGQDGARAVDGDVVAAGVVVMWVVVQVEVATTGSRAGPGIISRRTITGDRPNEAVVVGDTITRTRITAPVWARRIRERPGTSAAWSAQIGVSRERE